MVDEKTRKLAKDNGIELADNFSWVDSTTWPWEFKRCMELSASIALLMLYDQDKKMLDTTIGGLDEPVAMMFAIGERAEELRQAWKTVYATNNEPS